MPKYRIQLNNIDKNLIKSYSGLIQHPLPEKNLLKEVSREVVAQLKPVASWEIFPYDGKRAIVKAGSKIQLQGKKLPHRLCQCHHLVVMVVSLGPEVEKLASYYMTNGDFVKAILVQDAGFAALNQVSNSLLKQVRKHMAGKPWQLTARYLIGYGDGEMEDGELLLEQLKGEEMGIYFTGDKTISPQQTMLALIGVFDKNLGDNKQNPGTIPCQRCPMDNCDFREHQFRKPEEWQQYVQNNKFTVAEMVQKKEK